MELSCHRFGTPPLYIDYINEINGILTELSGNIGFSANHNSVELLKKPDELYYTNAPNRVPCKLRLQFQSEAIASKILKNDKSLRFFDKNRKVYVAPDRKNNERKARGKLKNKISQEPTLNGQSEGERLNRWMYCIVKIFKSIWFWLMYVTNE